MPDIDPIEQMFEFERKFYVSEPPDFIDEHAHHDLIIQSYVFAEEGYAIRVRVTVADFRMELPEFDPSVDRCGAYERNILAQVRDKVSAASITVKSVPVCAERYEFDHAIDPTVATAIIERSPHIIVKHRHSMWLDEDGWEFDEFAGQNSGLMIAECERVSPVVNLKIPSFCVTEVSGDHRFTNDYLSRQPWCGWGEQFKKELIARGPHFESF